MDLIIENASVLTADGAFVEAAVAIEDGCIADIGDAPANADTRYDAKGSLALPGVVDIHVIRLNAS